MNVATAMNFVRISSGMSTVARHRLARSSCLATSASAQLLPPASATRPATSASSDSVWGCCVASQSRIFRAGSPPNEKTFPADDDPDVQDLAAKVRSAVSSAAELLASCVVDEDFLQPSSPEQLPLLDGSPQAAKLVRFAPVKAQELLTDAVGDSAPMADIAWTARGETIGVIRFVPVRPGLVRTTEGTAPDELAIALYVTGGGEHATEQLLSWLSTNDDLRGRLAPPDPDTGQISVQVPDQVALRKLVEEIIDSMRGSDKTTEITFTSDNGRATLIAAEVMFVSVPDIAMVTQRIVRVLWP